MRVLISGGTSKLAATACSLQQGTIGHRSNQRTMGRYYSLETFSATGVVILMLLVLRFFALIGYKRYLYPALSGGA